LSIAELTHNVVARWDKNYPLLEFALCSKFQDSDIDPVENYLIPKENFYSVPLMQELVNQFQAIFCHLTVTQVWLLQKCKSGNGFQGWHQDKLTGLSNTTIMVNLGGSDNDCNNEEDDMQKSLVNNESALYTEAMGHKDDNDKEDDGMNIFGNKEAVPCKEAMEKNCKQETSAIKAMKICGRAAHEIGVGIDALVSLKVDYCTHCHAQGLLAIVYRFHTDTDGILVCCEHGAVTHDGRSNSYWVPYDNYKIIATNNSAIPISKKLQA
jgi:hypothetical protein